MSRIKRTLPDRPNGCFKFREESFPIDLRVFSGYSDVSLPRDLVIEDDVSRDSVVQFVNACQGREYEITIENCQDLSLLCRRFEVSIVGREVETFMQQHENTKGMLVLSLLRQVKEELATERIESIIRDNFADFIADERILSLPLQILKRIVNFDRISSSSGFAFLKKCLDRFGSSGSVLFSGFNMSRLSIEDFEILRNRGDFLWCLGGKDMGETIISLVSKNAELATILRTETERHSSQIEELIHANEEIVKRMREEFNEERKELKAANELALKKSERIVRIMREECNNKMKELNTTNELALKKYEEIVKRMNEELAEERKELKIANELAQKANEEIVKRMNEEFTEERKKLKAANELAQKASEDIVKRAIAARMTADVPHHVGGYERALGMNLMAREIVRLRQLNGNRVPTT
jgi:hypothetical protein